VRRGAQPIAQGAAGAFETLPGWSGHPDPAVRTAAGGGPRPRGAARRV